MMVVLIALWASQTPAQIPADPVFLTREMWKASPALAGLKPQVRKFITVHHGGVPAKPTVPTAPKIKNLQIWSQRADKLASGKEKPAWPDVPYHYWIGWDGQIAIARDDSTVGDTNTEYDPTGHVLICLEGDFSNEKPTAEQMTSLRNLSLFLAKKYRIPTEDLKTHRDYSKQTTCPGDNLYREMEDLRWWVLTHRKS